MTRLYPRAEGAPVLFPGPIILPLLPFPTPLPLALVVPGKVNVLRRLTSIPLVPTTLIPFRVTWRVLLETLYFAILEPGTPSFNATVT